jgi:peptide deformylase
MLKTKDILDEKDERLHKVSEEVTFPLSDIDKKLINDSIEYLTNSQIEGLAEKYDLRPGMGMAAVQLGRLK